MYRKITFIREYFWSGRDFYMPKDLTDSVKALLKSLVDEDNPEALNLMGAMLFEGKGFEMNLEQAFNFYKRAADRGNSLGMSNVGYCYYYGNGTKSDLEMAYKYLSMAALQDEWDAIIKLGDMYMKGEVVSCNREIGYQLYKKALSLSESSPDSDAYPASLTRVAECLYRGEGTVLNHYVSYPMLREAHKVATTQASSGNIYASNLLKRIEADFDELQILTYKINDMLLAMREVDVDIGL